MRQRLYINDMTKKPKVSIITVCLNSAGTIEQTIRSVLGQTYPNIEYIIIDGGSTDGTKEMLQKYKSGISCCLSEKDGGIYNAMNKGIENATGEVVGIINSDDWYAPGAVELAVSHLQTKGSQAVHGGLVFVYPDGRTREEKGTGKEVTQELHTAMQICHPTVFARKALYEKYGGFDESYRSAADYELMLRWYVNQVTIRYIPEVMAYFRTGGYSQTDFRIGMEESYNISMKYMERYNGARKEYYLERIRKMRAENEVRAAVKDKLGGLEEEGRRRIRERVTDGKEMILFGAGEYGLWCYEMLQGLGADIRCWMDNDRGRQGKELLGRLIAPCMQIDAKWQRILVGTKDYETEVARQLEAMGIGKGGYMLGTELERLLAGEPDVPSGCIG